MIAVLSGTLSSHGEGGLVYLQCGPVTLELHMPVLQAAELGRGQDVQLSTYLHFSSTADQIRLYAFKSALSRSLFVRLISSSGVGPKVALSLLDLGTGELVRAVSDGDEKALTRVSGVGPRLAKKIIAELSDRIADEFGEHAAASEAGAVAGGSSRAALEAVVSMGFARPDAEAALGRVLKSDSEAEGSELVRLLLAELSGG